MNVFRFRKFFVSVRADIAAQIGLANLISAACAPPSELDTLRAHTLHQSCRELRVRVLLHQIECIVGRPLGLEVLAVMLRIDPVEEAEKILGAQLIIRIEPLLLASTKNSADFSVTAIIGGKHEDEVRV